MEFVAAARIDLAYEPRDEYLLSQICDEAQGRDAEGLLDLVHYAIQVAGTPYAINELEQLLTDGGSVWSATSEGLQRRVPPAVQDAYEAAVSPADVASDELEEAWSNVYGRHPDPSDAWDHAIKAVEAILIPIVCPTKDKANLGSVAGDLKAQPGRFTFGLQSTGIGGVETLEAMIRLMWPNPDRHGGGPNPRVPTIEQARAVVQMAVTIAQWGRDGQIVRR